jgi:hypothetical protein
VVGIAFDFTVHSGRQTALRLRLVFESVVADGQSVVAVDGCGCFSQVYNDRHNFVHLT